MEEILAIQTAREEERLILRLGRMWSGGSAGGLFRNGGNGGHGRHADGTEGGFTDGVGGDRGSNQYGAPGNGNGRTSSWHGSVGAAASAVSTMVGATGNTGDMLMERAASVSVSTKAEAREAIG